MGGHIEARHIENRRSARRMRAFTIVETFAALLVIAVAIIGIAALYADKVHTPVEARLPLQAAELAETMAGRIRATSEGRDGFASTIGVLCDPDKKTPNPQDAAAQIAACWEDDVERTLPSGLGSISRDTSTNPVSYVIAVSWSAPESGTASYVTRVEPKG